MRLNRSMVLMVLAGLTLCFLGAAFALWFNPAGLPLVGAGNMPTPSASATASISGNNGIVHLTVQESGITAVDDSQLESANLTFPELPGEELILTRNGQPIPYWVQQREDGSTLYFYAQAAEQPGQPLSVYELRRGAGLMMQQRDAQPFNEGEVAGKHHLNWEEDRFFVEDAAAVDAWMGPLLLAPDRWTLHLDAIQPDGDTATLLVDIFSNVDTNDGSKHHVEIQLNGKNVAEHYWLGTGRKRIRVPLETGDLSPDDGNSLSIVVHDDTAPPGEAIYVDSVQLDYRGPVDISEQAVTFNGESPNIKIDGADEESLVFDISDPLSPVLLANSRYDGESIHLSMGKKEPTLIALNPEMALQPELESVPYWETSLLSPKQGADFIAVVANARGFEEALAPLLAHRQEQGMRVTAVSLEQIFDEFGYGHRDPQAIKDFISYAAQNWTPPAPRYILLVGDANYDVTNQIPGKNRNRLPTKMIYSANSGHVASDLWYVMDDDMVPTAAIGRFPVQNAPQLSNMVEKTILYEQELAAGDASWTGEALLVADDEPTYDEKIVELADYLEDSGYDVYRMHMSQDDNIRHNIVSAINQGVGLISYMGQGSESAWGDEAVFQNSDAQSLYNNAHLPIFNTFTCRSGSFTNPRTDSLAESLLWANNGGIIAAVAPSGDIAEEQQLPLTLLFHEQIMSDTSRLGDQLLQLYRAAGSSEALQDAVPPINLLGDPALQINHLRDGQPR